MAVALVVSALVAFPTTAGAELRSQTVTSAEAFQVHAFAWDLVTPTGYTSVVVDFLAPQGILAGSDNVIATGGLVESGPDSGVDLRKPWASVAVKTFTAPPGEPRTPTYSCRRLMNVSSWSPGYLEDGVREGVYLDVRCGDDGNGFEFYRFKLSFGLPPGVLFDLMGFTPVAITDTDEVYFAGEIRKTHVGESEVCGFDGTDFDCLAPAPTWPAAGWGFVRELGTTVVTAKNHKSGLMGGP